MKDKNTLVDAILNGDCIEILKTIPDQFVNMIYLDPPFFTQKAHTLVDSERKKKYSFDDKYETLNEYLNLIKLSLIECRRILHKNGSIFLHCDKTASHYLRVLLDDVFGTSNFINEIIWTYKRWSNSKKGLLNSHQIIFYYSVSKSFKFNTLYTDYSATTNIDQILQERERDDFGKAVYKKDSKGNVVKANSKKGVPLSDVWEIPFLNPKAKERTGYPTQKPVILLKKIIEISTDVGDIILDPFCGSGTTCVAAKAMKRKFIGIDISKDAVSLSKKRLKDMLITESQLLKKGKNNYIEKTDKELAILNSLNALPVQRNSSIDGFLKETLTPIIIQKSTDSFDVIREKIHKIYLKQKPSTIILIQTLPNTIFFHLDQFPCKIVLLKTLESQLDL
ncbi:MAG: hypothetical protein PEPC_01944 [Peptostreptococcus russellii]